MLFILSVLRVRFIIMIMAQVRRLGPKVGSRLALFCIHCVNWVNSRNDSELLLLYYSSASDMYTDRVHVFTSCCLLHRRGWSRCYFCWWHNWSNAYKHSPKTNIANNAHMTAKRRGFVLLLQSYYGLGGSTKLLETVTFRMGWFNVHLKTWQKTASLIYAQLHAVSELIDNAALLTGS